MELNELLKELNIYFVIRKIEKPDKILYSYCYIDCMIVKCKYCGTESHSVIVNILELFPILQYRVTK